MCCDSDDTFMPRPRPFPYPSPGACVLPDDCGYYPPPRVPNPGPLPPGYGDPVPGNVGVFRPNDPATGGTGFTPRTCKPVIPPWPGHHGGVDACFDGRGRVTSFRTYPERPGVVDPF